MHPALLATAHRPWPLPSGDWTWRQSWVDLAFIHYRVAAESIRARLPVGLELQEFDGSAWVGLVPFRMARVMARPWPSLPVFSTFPELNLRTYVTRDGKPGVWFFSLDAASLPIVIGGRSLYALPYFHARMSLAQIAGWHTFASRRSFRNVRFEACYRPVGETFAAEAGTFEHWATERYCLYSANTKGKALRVEVHHAPWPLQTAEVEIAANQILAAAGIEPLDTTPICHFSKGVDVVSYRPERI